MIRYDIYQPKGEITLAQNTGGAFVYYDDIRKLLFAVEEWIESKRPIDWNKDDHFENMHVNLSTETEKQLSDAYWEMPE